MTFTLHPLPFTCYGRTDCSCAILIAAYAFTIPPVAESSPKRDEPVARLPPCRADLDPILSAPAADVIRRREARLRVGVLGIVAGGVHHEHAVRIGVANRRINDGLLRRKRLAEAHVDDAGAVVYGITNRISDVLVAFVTIGDGTDHHHLHRGRDAADADGPVVDGAA